ncbi:MAG: tetratricopeptide repeat protein [Clostridia bacterium]|nr:tetratricopeptide repeat protein [Clostridia bacterium]
MSDRLDPRDYTDPACPFCTDAYTDAPTVRRVPMRRIVEKLDEYLARDDYEAAGRHLAYWEAEAREGGDREGLLSLRRAQRGLLRKTGQAEAATAAADESLELIEELGLGETVSAATVTLNAATVFCAFGQAERSVELFEAARRVYRKELPPDDPRTAGLCNNMALALADLGRADEALALYDEALDVLASVPGSGPEQAITHLNIADLLSLSVGEAEETEAAVEARLDRAERLLDDPALPRDGNYAFVCEKCAFAFAYHGRFAYAEELKQRAKEIYDEGTRARTSVL